MLDQAGTHRPKWSCRRLMLDHIGVGAPVDVTNRIGAGLIQHRANIETRSGATPGA
jgi:hypothetical protein